jgi:hypothetical protein
MVPVLAAPACIMGEKALWPTVWVVGLVCATITGLLLGGVDPLAIISVFSVFGSLISMMLYGKLQKIETQTNGMQTSHQDMVASLVANLTEYVKKSVPLEQEKV